MITPVVIGVSLGMLYRHVSNQEKRISRYGAGALNTSSEQSLSDQNRDRSYSRAVLNRALAYSCSYFLTWVWNIGGHIMVWRGVEIPLPYLYLWTIFFPLEGFFNLLIFMHPKVLAIKKSNETNNISWPRAFVETFWLGLTSRDSSQNNKAHAAASDKKKKNAHAALAGSGQNNNTLQLHSVVATLCSTLLVISVSEVHHIKCLPEELVKHQTLRHRLLLVVRWLSRKWSHD
eukprot:scaffold5867_cov25-Cyclotella_meneghiniana.AAC.2